MVAASVEQAVKSRGRRHQSQGDMKNAFCLLRASWRFALFAGPALARDQIRIVGSSTVYPFTTAVAEQFGKTSGMKTPVVESTGTGGGMKLFCAGVGEATPDFTNASRRIKKSEYEELRQERRYRYRRDQGRLRRPDARQFEGRSGFSLTKKQIFQALAKEVPDASGKLVANPYKMWNEIDPSLPAEKIEVLGPPPTSGTRDSLRRTRHGKGRRGDSTP